MLPCPLCLDPDVESLERIPLTDLDAEYRRQVGVSILTEFPQGTASIDLRRCPRCGLESFDPCVAGSAQFYASLGKDEPYYSTTRWEFTETLRRLSPDPDLIDIGCGDGFFLRSIPGSRRRGIELNPDAARRARDSGLEVQTLPLEQLPHASADVVTMFQVLEHVADPRTVADTVARVLRPGGQWFVAVPNNDNWVGEAPPNPLNAPPHHTLRWRADALRHLAQVARLELVEFLEEPLASEHLYPYRRAQWAARWARLTGRRLPRYGIAPSAVAVRKLATLSTEISLRLHRRAPTQPGTGHSLLAVYRKPNSE